MASPSKNLNTRPQNYWQDRWITKHSDVDPKVGRDLLRRMMREIEGSDCDSAGESIDQTAAAYESEIADRPDRDHLMATFDAVAKSLHPGMLSGSVRYRVH